MKKHLSTMILILAFLIGLSLLLYPSVSDYINSMHQSRAIARYDEQVSDLNEAEYEAIWQKAVAYNERSRPRRNSRNIIAR